MHRIFRVSLLVIAMFAVLSLHAANEVMALPCDYATLSEQGFSGTESDLDTINKENKCFKTASGYTFFTIGNIPGISSWEGSIIPTVDKFPMQISNGDCNNLAQNPIAGPDDSCFLWLYGAIPPPKGFTRSSLSQISLQVPLSSVTALSADGILIYDTSRIFVNGGSPFLFDPEPPGGTGKGCLGDSTSGFETGDYEECGIKITVKLNPGGLPNRFYFLTVASNKLVNQQKTEAQVFAAKIGSILEPGHLLGASSLETFTLEPSTHYTCLNVKDPDTNTLIANLKVVMDGRGCSKEAYLCQTSDVDCKLSCDVKVNPSSPKLYLCDKNTNIDLDGNECNPSIMESFKTLRRMGSLYGDLCNDNFISLKGSTCVYKNIGGYPCRICN